MKEEMIMSSGSRFMDEVTIKYEDVKNQTTEDYFNGNKFSIDAFQKKYILHSNETYVQAVKRVCDFIASVEKTEELRKYWSERWFDEIYNDWWHPAGSIMQGAGSGRKISLANCTNNSLGRLRNEEEWDNLESIVRNTAYTVSKCAAYRQGLGVDFCLAPGTLILTSDLHHIPVEKLSIGDKLIGFNEKLNFTKSTFEECVVENIRVIKRPSYKVITDKGEVVSSSEHLWVARDNKKKSDGRTMCNYEWRTTDKLKIGDELAFTTIPWKEVDSWEGGYLSGILDGEGWLSDHQIGIGQNKGFVFDKIISILDKYKIDYYVSSNNSGCQCIRPKGKWENAKLIGMFRSQRLLRKSDSLWKDRKMGGKSNPPAKVLSIEFVGEIEVIATTTSTKTLIANGFLTHNSRIRPAGTKVLNSANESTGAVHWMKFIDSIGYYVGQKGRIPAMLFSLDISHPDVEKFITIKSDYTQIQNANISVQITEDFYDAVEKDGDWLLHFEICGHKKGDKVYVDVHSIDMNCIREKETGRYYKLATHDREQECFVKSVKARELLKLIAKNMHANAEPGIQNIDIARKYSNSDAMYDPNDEYDSRIIGTNACSEQYLSRDSLCVLASINCGRFSITPEIYVAQLEKIGKSVNRFLDNTNECELVYQTFATPHQELAIRKLRRTGAGVTNIAAWLFKKHLIYGTQEANDAFEEFIKIYNYWMYIGTEELGKEKGDFGLFNSKKWKSAPFVSRIIEESKKIAEKYKTPIMTGNHARNATVSSIAPTGTLTLMFRDLSFSYGIEPAFFLYYWKRTRMAGKYEYYFNVPKVVREAFEAANIHIPITSDAIKDEWDGRHGKNIAEFIEKNKEKVGIKFKTSTQILAEDKLQFMSQVMKWIDSSISVTYMLPENSTWKDVYNFILNAHKKEVKSIAAFPDKKMYGIVSEIPFEDLALDLRKQNIEIHHQNFSDDELKVLNISRENIIPQKYSPERLTVLDADIYSVTAKGEKFIICVGIQNGKPFEAFAGHMNGFGLKANFKKGKIIRVKSGQYSLEFDDVTIEDFSKQFTPTEQILFRFVSLSLSKGIPIQDIVDQLQKGAGDITSLGAAAARVLKKYIKDGEKIQNQSCPMCGNGLVFMEGCVTCSSCGFSRCN